MNIEFKFNARVIENKKELENIMEGKSEKDLLVIQKIVIDKDSFQPNIIFAIKEESLPFSQWLKYVARLEVLAEGNLELK